MWQFFVKALLLYFNYLNVVVVVVVVVVVIPFVRSQKQIAIVHLEGYTISCWRHKIWEKEGSKWFDLLLNLGRGPTYKILDGR